MIEASSVYIYAFSMDVPPVPGNMVTVKLPDGSVVKAKVHDVKAATQYVGGMFGKKTQGYKATLIMDGGQLVI